MRSLIHVFSASLIIAFGLITRAFALEIPLYDKFEAELLHTGSPQNPYKQISAQVTFTQPDGATVSIPMFWDGGNTWRVRLSPWMVGRWTYTTSSSDAGLNNQSGEFDCIPSTNKGALTQKADAAYHFAYQDGTPVWWFGDTNWYQFASLPTENLNHETANAYIDTRSAQGFNVVHAMLYTRRGNEGGAPFSNMKSESINPAFFREIDSRLAHMNERGVTAGLVLAWGFGDGSWLDFPSAEARLRFARYAVARYSAYNVYFLASAEWGLFPRAKGDARSFFRPIAEMVAATDPHHRLLGIHADPFHSQSEPFADEAWSSFGDYQQFYGRPPRQQLATDASRDVLAKRLADARDHGKPVVNGEYAYYMRDRNGDGIGDKENSRNVTEFRKASWVLAMTGGYFVTGFGSTYRGGTNDPGGFDYAKPSNNEAVANLVLLRSFFQSFPWWTLEPRNDLVSGKGYHYALALPGQTYLVYTTSSAPVTLSLDNAEPGAYFVKSFDPRTGTYTPIPGYVGNGTITLTPPTNEDWAFVVQRAVN